MTKAVITLCGAVIPAATITVIVGIGTLFGVPFSKTQLLLGSGMGGILSLTILTMILLERFEECPVTARRLAFRTVPKIIVPYMVLGGLLTIFPT